MEDFYKKHNFDTTQDKSRNRRFHIVRYFPKIQTYEFINVGIILYDKNEVYYRMLQTDEISKLHCPSLIESKILRSSINSLDEYLQGQQQLDTILENVSKRYKNILDTSFQMAHYGAEGSQELVNKLFYDYIGYKFDSVEKETTLSKLINKTETIIKHDFKRYLKVQKSQINGFSLDFFNEQTKDIHHSLIGSIESSENVAKAFINAPINPLENQKYDFLNTKVKIADAGINNRLKLQKLQLGVYNYSDEDDIARYCENILN